jgi:hypothetical protein
VNADHSVFETFFGKFILMLISVPSGREMNQIARRLLFAALVCATVVVNSCENDLITVPTITAPGVDSVMNTTVVISGDISSDGGAPVTSRGFCWDTKEHPTFDLATITQAGTGTGAFKSKLTGLTKNTVYYARAYAVNIAGTSYGDEVSFLTKNSTSVTGSAYPKDTDFLTMDNSRIPMLDSIKIGANYQRRSSIFWNNETSNGPWSIEVDYVQLPDLVHRWTIYLYGVNPPTHSETFQLTDDYTNLQPGTACLGYVRYFDGYLYFYYYSISGQLDVEVINGQVSASFSNIQVTEESSGNSHVISGHITCH